MNVFQTSKRSDRDLYGRNDANIKVIIPSVAIPASLADASLTKPITAGDLIMVKVNDSNSQVLKGQPLYHCQELI